MAYYAALMPVIELLDDILHHNRYPKLPPAQNTILITLHEKFSLLEDSLQGYSSKGSEDNDRVEGRVRDVAYCVLDVIESEISHQILVSRGKARANESIFHESSPLSGVCLPARPHEVKKSNFRKLFSDLKVAVCRQKRHVEYIEYLRMMLQEIDSIVQEVIVIKEKDATEGFKLSRDSFEISDSEKATSVGSNTMVGFDADLTTIKEKLCGQSTKLRVIPIVGMGGIGKTTLARNTFDDAYVVYYFDHRVWVTVSQDYQLNQVLQSIKSSLNLGNNRQRQNLEVEGASGMTIKNKESSNWEGVMEERNNQGEIYKKETMASGDGPSADSSSLEERICKHLKGRRYLIVMDDVWNTEVWDDVKWLFPDDCNGSRIMLTTRLLDVARYASTSNVVHEMQFLDDEESWNLLERKVFAQESCPSELERIGRIIACQCHGLPLALVVVAGILSDIRTRDHWKNVAENVRAILSSSNEPLMGILSLSYNHLPHNLKACFLYMACFPEDYEIEISNLIYLWIAEGFLKSESKSKLRLEELGEECLNDLVRRNLVMMKKPEYGEFEFCVLHDILRDFCRQRALYEGFFHGIRPYLYDEYLVNSSAARRININVDHLDRVGADSCIFDPLVRSILSFENSKDYTELPFFRSTSVRPLLRVMNFSKNRPIINLRSEMFHLKYLKLGPVLPLYQLNEWISLHVNLQTIILTDSLRHHCTLCFQIWKMTQLRHVIIYGGFWLPPPPVNRMQKLEYLQTLMNVVDFTITDEVVKMIPNLRNLGIVFDEIKEGHCLHNLVCFHHLEVLQMKYGVYYDSSDQFACFPQSFALLSSLRELYIDSMKLTGEELRMMGCLPKLQGLKLENVRIDGKVWDVTEEEFPRLKFLLMIGLVDLKEWRAEGSLFPCLEILNIGYCFFLKEIPLQTGDIPALRLIEVRHSPSCELSAIKIREEQQELGNELLRVRIHDY